MGRFLDIAIKVGQALLGARRAIPVETVAPDVQTGEPVNVEVTQEYKGWLKSGTVRGILLSSFMHILGYFGIEIQGIANEAVELVILAIGLVSDIRAAVGRKKAEAKLGAPRE